MIRYFAAALALTLGASAASAADLDGKLTVVDLKANTITLPVDGKDQQYPLASDCKVYVKGHAGRGVAFSEAAAGTKALAAGQTVSVTTDFIDGKEEATRIKINEGATGGRPPAAVRPTKTEPAPKPNPAKPDDKPSDKPATTGFADSLDVTGVVSALDPKRMMITLTTGDHKSQKYKVDKAASCFLVTPSTTGKGKQREKIAAAPNGLADVTVGANVSLSFADADKKLVSMIKIIQPAKKK
jgi:hypothetical protein